MYIINLSGEKELFSRQKVYKSARRVGASKNLAQKISETIEKEAYPDMKTMDIFMKVKKMLSKKSPNLSLKFSLKVAMRKLGPSGFLFEKYIGRVFSSMGFNVKLNQHPYGKCLKYEIDFFAQKNNLFYIGECKYRNLSEGKVHSNVVLANYARFLDLSKGSLKIHNPKTIVVTNTKFTKAAIKYSQCVGADLMGWNYPKKRGLEYFIDSLKLYPITILPSFKKSLYSVFVLRKIILAKDLLRIDALKFSKQNNIPLKYIEKIIKEAKTLCLTN